MDVNMMGMFTAGLLLGCTIGSMATAFLTVKVTRNGFANTPGQYLKKEIETIFRQRMQRVDQTTEKGVRELSRLQKARNDIMVLSARLGNALQEAWCSEESSNAGQPQTSARVTGA